MFGRISGYFSAKLDCGKRRARTCRPDKPLKTLGFSENVLERCASGHSAARGLVAPGMRRPERLTGHEEARAIEWRGLFIDRP